MIMSGASLQCNKLTFQCRANVLPNGEATAAVELSKGQFHVEQRQSTQQQHDTVRDEKGATSILVANIGESPDVAQINGESDHGQQELGLLAPMLAWWIRGNRHLHNPVLAGLGGHPFRLQRIAVFGGRWMGFARVPIVTAVAVCVVGAGL